LPAVAAGITSDTNARTPTPTVAFRRSVRFVIVVIVAVSAALILIAHESTITVLAVVVVMVAVIGPVDEPLAEIVASIGVV